MEGINPTMTEPRWIVLIHQLPPTPMYLRAKIRNRLERAGAVALKNSVYLLPRNPECLEDFQWIAQEAITGGGEAWVLEADLSFGLEPGDLEERFRRARAPDFDSLAQELRAALKEASSKRRKGASPDDLVTRFNRLQKRFEELSAIDFFHCPERHGAEIALESIRERLRPAEGLDGASAGRSDREKLKGRTWVTRTGVHVDRIASAWLIRRFVDPEAAFRFVPTGTKEFAPDEIRFDMVGGQFTHEGDRCTFETLVRRLAIADGAVAQIAEIVHDIDLKDGKFARIDAVGVNQLIAGLVLAHADDESRLERGFALFDDLHRSFAAKARPTAPEPERKARHGRSR